MHISDLSDPQAVFDAISEYDEIGPVDFRSKYGFGHAVINYVQLDGRKYDSRAVAAAAIEHQYGHPLSNDLTDKDPVAQVLESLGFRITGLGDWHYRTSDVTRRSEIARTYGGAVQGGIEPSARTPNVFLFTDPTAGAEHGYNFDGWDPGDPLVFHYSGEGQVGDQRIESRGNAATLKHASQGRILRLFESEPSKRAGGKLQTYVGAFRIDPDAPFRLEDAPDRLGNLRKVIVFRLLVDESAPNAGDPRAERPDTADEYGLVAEAIDPERNNVREYETSPTTGSRARRDEGHLVQMFENYLRAKGHLVNRRRFTLPKGQGTLITDTFDQSEQVLYEAKSDIKRSTVRLALGQLLDYRRLFDMPVRARILLPDRPTDDLVELLHEYDVGLTYQIEDNWATVDPARNDH